MLRIYFMQNWFNLSDPAAEDSLYDSESMRRFAGIELAEDAMPDESTILRFRHLLEQHQLTEQIFAEVRSAAGGEAAAAEVRDDRGCDDHRRAALDQERREGARSGDAADQEGQAVALRHEGAYKARAACHQALGQAAHTNHPFSLNVVNVFAAMLAVDLAEHDAVAGYAAALARDRDRSRVFEVNAEAMIGYAEAAAGQPEGVARILRAIDALGTPNPMPAARSMLMRLLVGAYAIAGGAEAALDASDVALSIGGTRLWEPEIRRLRAEFLVRSGRDRSDIEAELDRAAHVAAMCGARGPARLVEETRARLLDPPVT